MKKVLGTLLAGAAALALTLTATFALPSSSVNGGVVGEPTFGGEVIEGASVAFESGYEGIANEEITLIESLNAGTSISEVLQNEDVILPEGLSLKDFSLLTQVQNLVARDADGNVIKDAKNVKVTWEVPNLTGGAGEIYVLHFSTKRNVWEVITPDNVDLVKKTVTATFPDLSPVAVVYVPKDGASTGDGNKDDDGVKTGVTSNAYMFALAGLVALGGAAFIVRRKRSM